MGPFAYGRATTLEEALTVGADPDTMLLAGGTELLNWLRLGVATPRRLLDIGRLDELATIEPLRDQGLRIGALARLADVASDERVCAGWPVLRQAIDKSASAQVRNLATIGGNLLQKTRCAYFRSDDRTVPCNRRRPGSGCAAVGGFSDRHALFGWTDACGAVFPSDPAVALAVLDAEVVTARPGGGRRIPVHDLHVLPRDQVEVGSALEDTVLEPGEVIEAIELARPAPWSAYVKVRERESYEFALVSAAAAVELDPAGRISVARVALGSVAMRPWRLEDVGRRLVGLEPRDAGVADALVASLADAMPFGQSGFKASLACAAARRAIHLAAEVVPA